MFWVKIAIVRIDFPFGNEKFSDKDYVLKILKFLKNGGKLYENQYITPSYILDLVKAIKIIAENKLGGVFHVATRDRTTPYDFGKMIVEKRGLVYEVNGSKFPDGVLMPKYAGLDVGLTERALGIEFGISSDALDEFLFSPAFDLFMIAGK